MNTTAALVERLNSNLKFREMFNAQLRECEIEVSVTISQLFQPFLEELREKIWRDDYELTVNPYLDEDYDAARDGQPPHVVKINFMWEPIDANDFNLFYHEVVFNGPLQYDMVLKTLARFANVVGMPVVM